MLLQFLIWWVQRAIYKRSLNYIPHTYDSTQCAQNMEEQNRWDSYSGWSHSSSINRHSLSAHQDYLLSFRGRSGNQEEHHSEYQISLESFHSPFCPTELVKSVRRGQTLDSDWICPTSARDAESLSSGTLRPWANFKMCESWHGIYDSSKLKGTRPHVVFPPSPKY